MVNINSWDALNNTLRALTAAALQEHQAALELKEANRLKEEIRLAEEKAEKIKLELMETRRINTLFITAMQEVKGVVSGTSHIEAIFKEDAEVIEKFLATKPLEGAIIANALDVVKLLVSKGQRYDSWQDIVDEGTPLYNFLSETFKVSNLKRFTP